jgi:DNA-binding protein H-NS
MTKKPRFESMTVDELWLFYEKLSQVLSVRLTSEKRELEKRLAQVQRENKTRIAGATHPASAPKEKRQYPRVLPKYRNPHEPSETWSGRGKTPRWLTAALKTGHAIEEFAIHDAEASTGAPRRRGAQRSPAA